MPFEIVRNDITNMCVDAIVNTANPKPIIGAGVDSRIHEKAGPELLLAREKIGNIDRGCAVITPAFHLQAKYVIHTVGPMWFDGEHNEAAFLHNCYNNSLNLAWENQCASIAFPLISTGNYGFPKDKALQIAITAFSSFLLEHEMQIYLVVFDKAAYTPDEHPMPGPPINYPNGAPEFKQYVRTFSMDNYIIVPDGSMNFETISEFKRSLSWGAEIEFIWNDVTYGVIRYGTNNKITIYQANSPETEKVCDTADDALEYMLGDDRLRDVITKVNVISRTI